MTIESQTLSPMQAYRAMVAFLEREYRLTGSDDLGALLGELQLMEDGKPFDQGAWADWLSAISEVISLTRKDEKGPTV